MKSNKRNRFRALLGRLRSGDVSFTGMWSPKAAHEGASTNLTDPVMNYYRHRLKTHLPTFSRFALQSRSLKIRDTFANAATGGRHDLAGLLSALDTCYNEQGSCLLKPSQQIEAYNPTILLALASNIANTSRGDLDTHAAIKIYDFVFSLFGPDVFEDQHRLQYVEALADIERYEDVEKLRGRLEINTLAPLQSELIEIQRVRRDRSASEVDWLKAMNALYRSLGMTPIQFATDPALPLMDRLRANPAQIYSGPKVSVIMPTYSPGKSIRTAIRSLLEQSWKNIEVIVVDDASPDEFRPLFDELKELDPRVQVMHQPNNAGAYLARNAGLTQASGEFVTTHDDDDWSHPDKIATQVTTMVNDPSIVATTSSHIRTTPDMKFQRINVRAQYMQLNYSSLMFKREIIERIGSWDSVNRGGDSEFMERVTQYFGEEHVLHIADRPLSFSRIRLGSLTSGEMSRGYFATSRLLYASAFRQWHSNYVDKDLNSLTFEGEKRQFPVPSNFEPGARNKDLGIFDVIYVSDFFRQSPSAKFALQDMQALAESGYRVGYMHLQSPRTNRAMGFSQKLFDLQLEGQITQVSHNDRAHAKLLIIYDAAIGMFADQMTSSVTTTQGIVIHHELPGASNSEMRTPTLISHAINELDRVFSTTFKTVGATPIEQRGLHHVLPSPRVLADAWTWGIHLDQAPAAIVPPMKDPVVGFHTLEGSQYRWPVDQDVFEKVYISSFFETRLYGSIVVAKNKFSQPVLEQVETFEADDIEELAFLKGIDFWVYYPHDRFQDHVWAPALNAMQAGKVVILPPSLESIYGEAAIYAPPEGVQQVITDLMGNPERYVAQAKRGQDFVAQKYTRKKFLERIRNLIPIAEQSI